MSGPYPAVICNDGAVAEACQQPVSLGVVQHGISRKEKEAVAVSPCTYRPVGPHREAAYLIHPASFHYEAFSADASGDMYVAESVGFGCNQHFTRPVDNYLGDIIVR